MRVILTINLCSCLHCHSPSSPPLKLYLDNQGFQPHAPYRLDEIKTFHQESREIREYPHVIAHQLEFRSYLDVVIP